MTTEGDRLGLGAADLLRKAAQERSELTRDLSGFKFRAMMQELRDPALFDLDLSFPGWGDVGADRPARTAPDHAVASMPALTVPLGDIHDPTAGKPTRCVGILCEAADDGKLADLLVPLLRLHRTAPFARLLFICRTALPIPFLGRYGFGIEFVDGDGIDAISDRLSARYDLVEIRALAGGTLVWSRTG